jgi:YVTN family beta-propeller protein
MVQSNSRIVLKFAPALAAISLLAVAFPPAARAADTTQPTTLPTGRSIDSPIVRDARNVGSMPMNLVISPDGKFAVTTSDGSREKLCSIRVSDGTEVSSIDFPTSKLAHSNGLYYGIAFGPDGRLYAAQGAEKKVAICTISDTGVLQKNGFIPMYPHDFPAGVAIDGNGLVYVTQNDPTINEGQGPADDPGVPQGNRPAKFGTTSSVSVHDPATGMEIGRYFFKDDLGLSHFPLAVCVTRDGSRLFVGSQRDDAVYVLDTSDPTSIKLVTALGTGSHPICLLLNKDQSLLYVANAQSDTVSVVDARSLKIINTVLLRPDAVRDLAGATPTGLALSSDGSTLYVSLGDMNAVAVIDLAKSEGPAVRGYFPVGWYPTSLALAGDHLFVTNAKGDRAVLPNPPKGKRAAVSPLELFEGTLWRVTIPQGADLDAMTQQCLTNSRLTPQYIDRKNPLQGVSLASGNIQHVIYVIKENRTYDQVLGDVPAGNGDPKRCIFGREITPNLHALADRFVLLDNFYCSGEVSGDGWTWSTQAQANEYTIRNVPYQYSNRGRTFDYEGTNNDYPAGGFPAVGLDGKPLSEDPRFEKGAKPVPDVAASAGGHLWDMARKHGLSYRNYGMFMTNQTVQDGKVSIPDNYPDSAGVQPGGRDLAGITDLDFRRFDLHYPDSDAAARLETATGNVAFRWEKVVFGQSNVPSRISEWKREFAMMLDKDRSGKGVPALMTVRLGTDHTYGAKGGRPTPRCMVADNDFAIGELIEAVSQSPIWKSCAVVILEDDAQNGPDHVDAHRSPAYIVSPWIKKGAVDHSFQNTVSMLRTIECLLNLPPMCQYDAASNVIDDWDTAPNNAEPFTPQMPPAQLMLERNPKPKKGQPEAEPGPQPVDPELKPAPKPAAPGPGQGDDENEKPSSSRSEVHFPDLDDLKTAQDLAAASELMDFSKADQVPADLLSAVIWKTVKGPDAEVPPTPHTIAPAGRPAHPKKDDDD